MALFGRSLREDINRKATYQARAVVAVVIWLILTIAIVAISWTGAQGRRAFMSIAFLQFGAITLAGLTYFSSAIAEEKEEQMLGLLRMTGLSPLSVVLGKSTSRLCGVLLLLAAQFPFTVIAVTLGGISLGQVVATYCTLAAYSFLLCNVALLGSVLMRHIAGAAAFTAFVGTLHFAGGPLLGAIAGQWPTWRFSPPLRSASGPLWESTIVARLSDILTTGFSDSPVGWQVATNVAGGVVCFLLAWAAFGHFCDRAASGTLAPEAGGRSWARSWFGNPPRPVANALAWKDFHFMCGGKSGMILRGVLYGGSTVVVLAAWILHPGWADHYRRMVCSVVPLIYSLDVGGMAARIFRVEIRNQTLSTLAVLPCDLREIAMGKLRGFLLAAAPGAIAVIIAGILLLGPWNIVNGRWDDAAFAIVALWSNIPVLAFLAALFSLDMKYGALPVSYVVTLYISGRMGGLSGMEGFGTFIGACVISFLCAIYFHREIPKRLETIASRD
jgi:hypothetical protein